jgi:CCR4-NOT transcription complex subunit 7/8
LRKWWERWNICLCWIEEGRKKVEEELVQLSLKKRWVQAADATTGGRDWGRVKGKKKKKKKKNQRLLICCCYTTEEEIRQRRDS